MPFAIQIHTINPNKKKGKKKKLPPSYIPTQIEILAALTLNFITFFLRLAHYLYRKISTNLHSDIRALIADFFVVSHFIATFINEINDLLQDIHRSMHLHLFESNNKNPRKKTSRKSKKTQGIQIKEIPAPPKIKNTGKTVKSAPTIKEPDKKKKHKRKPTKTNSPEMKVAKLLQFGTFKSNNISQPVYEKTQCKFKLPDELSNGNASQVFTFILPKPVETLISFILEKYKVYAVGGLVRDLLIKHLISPTNDFHPNDYDLVVDIKNLDTFQDLLCDKYKDVQMQIYGKYPDQRLTITLSDNLSVDISPRKNKYIENAAVRDFTINSFYMEFMSSCRKAKVFSPLPNAWFDLFNQQIAFTPTTRDLISSDNLLTLRLIDLSFKTGFMYDEEAFLFMSHVNLSTLINTSEGKYKERLLKYTKKILTYPTVQDLNENLLEGIVNFYLCGANNQTLQTNLAALEEPKKFVSTQVKLALIQADILQQQEEVPLNQFTAMRP